MKLLTHETWLCIQVPYKVTHDGSHCLSYIILAQIYPDHLSHYTYMKQNSIMVVWILYLSRKSYDAELGAEPRCVSQAKKLSLGNFMGKGNGPDASLLTKNQE